MILRLAVSALVYCPHGHLRKEAVHEASPSQAPLPSVEFFDPRTRAWSRESPSFLERSATGRSPGSCEGDTSAVTYVLSSSARVCPSLHLLDMVLRSHHERMDGFAQMKKLLVFDGFGDAGGPKRLDLTRIDRAKYDRHKEMVSKFLLSSPLYQDVAVMALPQWGGLLRGVHIALEKAVKTPYVYIAQDDAVVRAANVSARKIIASMEQDDRIKYVRLSWRSTGGIGSFADSLERNQAPPSSRSNEKPILEKHCADLYRDNYFSDKNHFTRRQWYLDRVITPVDPNISRDLLRIRKRRTFRNFWMDQSGAVNRLMENGTTGGYMYSLGTDPDLKMGELNTHTIDDVNARSGKWCRETAGLGNGGT